MVHGTIGVGSVITNAEFIELPGNFAKLTLYSKNPDDSEGFAWFEFTKEPESIKKIELDVIRGGEVTRSAIIDGDLVIEFVNQPKGKWTMLRLLNVQAKGTPSE